VARCARYYANIKWETLLDLDVMVRDMQDGELSGWTDPKIAEMFLEKLTTPDNTPGGGGGDGKRGDNKNKGPLAVS
jgi:hypothetical protein